MRNGNEDDVRAVATALEQTLAGDWVVHLTQYQGCPVSTSDTTDQVNGDVEGLLATLDGPMWRTLGRSRFDLAGNPDPATLVVEVDGAVITTWSYDATSRTVVFDTTYRAQPGAQVVVTYSDAEGCP
jgi:hypothetical protein